MQQAQKGVDLRAREVSWLLTMNLQEQQQQKFWRKSGFSAQTAHLPLRQEIETTDFNNNNFSFSTCNFQSRNVVLLFRENFRTLASYHFLFLPYLQLFWEKAGQRFFLIKETGHFLFSKTIIPGKYILSFLNIKPCH